MFGLVGFVVWRVMAAPPEWRVHESAAGGYKVEFPAAPMSDVSKRLGVPLPPGAAAEGTTHRRGEYVVLWAEIQQRGWRTDDQILEDTFQGALEGEKPKRVVRGEPFTVGGFPARDLEMTEAGGESGILRAIVADTRLYVLVVGGRSVDAKSPDARRFLDSFTITDPRLLGVGKRKEQEAEVVRQRAQAEQERVAKLQWEKDELRRQEAERLAAVKAAAEATRREAEAEADKFLAPQSAISAPDPTDMPRLQVYLSFNTEENGKTPLLPGSSLVSMPTGSKIGSGVRGTALYLTGRSGGLSLPTQNLHKTFANPPITVAGWVKVRGVDCDLFKAPHTHGGDLLTVGVSRQRVYVRLNGGDSTKPYFPGEHEWNRMSAPLDAERVWHHIAFTWSIDRGTALLYVDGKQEASFRFRPGLAQAPKGVTLGEPYTLGDNGYSRMQSKVGPLADLPTAAIDELCVFNRPLTQNEVAYLAGKTKSAGETSVTRLRLAPQLAIDQVSGVAFDPERKLVWAVTERVGYWTVEEWQKSRTRPEQPVYLVRYSYPEFKETGRWLFPTGRTPQHVPGSASPPLLDIKNNRLFVSLWYGSGGVEFLQRGPAWHGDFYRFDLDDVPEGDEAKGMTRLKPANPMPIEGRASQADIGGGVLSPDGKWLYFTQSGTETSVWKYPTDLSMAGEEVLVPGHFIWGRHLGVSGIGTRVRVIQGGKESQPAGRGLTGMLEIDAETWKPRRVVGVNGVVWGKWVPHTAIAIHPDGRVFAGGPAGITETEQGADKAHSLLRPVPLELPGFMTVSGDGRYLFAAEAEKKQNRLSVLDVRATAELFDAVAELDEEPGVRVGGPFTVSPDGKHVVFRSGLVVRLDEGEDALKPLPKRDPSLEPKK